MEFSKEFKAALSQFSSKEKDKLIFRLLKKDKLLSKKLYFELRLIKGWILAFQKFLSIRKTTKLTDRFGRGLKNLL